MTTRTEAAAEAGRVRVALGLAEDASGWLQQLAAIGAPRDPVPLPRGDEAHALLRRLDVPDHDAAEIVAAAPDPHDQPELWWLLERTHHKLIGELGDFTTMDFPPTLPYELGVAARYFYVYVFLASVPAARRYQEARGIPEQVAWSTLDQLGELVRVHRRKFGIGGVDHQFWFTLHLRGVIYRLGRLQFNLQTLDDSASPLQAGRPVLGTHIPELGGPMTPQACDESFRRALPFYDTYFPEHGATVAVCTSWLLDPQLADYLPETSNIVRFMRRWRLVDAEPKVGDDSILEFVFRRGGQALTELPRRTTLERAVLAHLDAGKHWHQRTGWVELNSP